MAMVQGSKGSSFTSAVKQPDPDLQRKGETLF